MFGRFGEPAIKRLLLVGRPTGFILLDEPACCLRFDHRLRTHFASLRVRCGTSLLTILPVPPSRKSTSALMPSVNCFSTVSMPTPSWSRSEEHTSELQSLMRISYA